MNLGTCEAKAEFLAKRDLVKVGRTRRCIGSERIFEIIIRGRENSGLYRELRGLVGHLGRVWGK